MAIASLTDIPISKRKDGRGYTFRYRAADGSRPRVTRPTLEEALVAWLELECDYVIQPLAELEAQPASTGPTLTEFFEQTYCAEYLPGLAEDTQARYRVYFRDFAATPLKRKSPREDEEETILLGDTPITEIGTSAISTFIAALGNTPRKRLGKETGGNVGTETIRKVLTMLQGVFTLAIEKELISGNPVSATRKPSKAVPTPVRPLSVEQVEALRRYFLDRGDVWSMFYVVLVAHAGLRPSEPLALRLSDVRQRTLLVHRTASRGKARHLKNKLPYRTVLIEPHLREDIDLTVRRLGLTGDDLLLADEHARMLDNEQRKSWHRYVLQPALLELHLPITRTYDLRHTCASLMLAAHRSLHEVATQLGHGADMTATVYGHEIDEYRGQPAIDIAARVRAVRSPESA